MSASCVLTECMDYYNLYNNCLVLYPTSALDQEKCICTPSAITYYTKCYPCVTSLPTTTTPIMSVANYTATCNALSSNPGAGYTFSGFTGLPTSTGLYYPIPSGTGGSGSGSGSGSNNSNSGSSDKGGSSNTGLYAGIGAGVGVVVLGAALFFWHRSRKNKKPTKAAELPPTPAMQAVHNHHQPPPQPQPPLPVVPVQHQYSQYNPPSTQTGYQQQYPDQQNQFQQQQNQYQQQYTDQQQQQNHYQPQTVVPQQQQQYTSQPPVVTNFYGQAGGGSYPDPNTYDPNQQHQGYYPTASTAAPLPQPVPSPTFPPNDYYQQQQQQQQQAQHTFSPVVTTSGIHQQQEPMPMPEQSNPYGLTSPSATTNTTAYSPAMTTSNSTSYETPATTAFAYEAPASIVPPVAGTGGVNKVSTHGPQVIHVQGQQTANFPKNPQYVEPHQDNTYHN